MDATESHPDPNRWWKHRRRGYYTGKWWAILQTPCWVLLGIYDTRVLESMGVVIGWSYGISVTLIVSYFGNNIAEAWAGKVKQ